MAARSTALRRGRSRVLIPRPPSRGQTRRRSSSVRFTFCLNSNDLCEVCFMAFLQHPPSPTTSQAEIQDSPLLFSHRFRLLPRYLAKSRSFPIKNISAVGVSPRRIPVASHAGNYYHLFCHLAVKHIRLYNCHPPPKSSFVKHNLRRLLISFMSTPRRNKYASNLFLSP